MAEEKIKEKPLEENSLGQSFLSTENIPTEMPETFDLRIIDLDKIVFEGKAKITFIPTPLGEVAILPGHTPLFIQLVSGIIKIEKSPSGEETVEIIGGLARITQDEATILVGFGGEEKASEGDEAKA